MEEWFTTDDGLQPSSASSPITDAGDATKLPSDIDGDTTKAFLLILQDVVE